MSGGWILSAGVYSVVDELDPSVESLLGYGWKQIVYTVHVFY